MNWQRKPVKYTDSKPKMKEIEKQLREKFKDRNKISEIDSQIFQITEKKKNEILEKLNKKLSHLKSARDTSYVTVKNQTDNCSKTAKTKAFRDGKEKKHS